MLTLKNDYGVVKKVPIGFSWTILFFGIFPPLFRRDWKWSAIMFVAITIGNAIAPGIGVIVISLGFAFVYNDLYLTDLKEKGYKEIH